MSLAPIQKSARFQCIVLCHAILILGGCNRGPLSQAPVEGTYPLAPTNFGIRTIGAVDGRRQVKLEFQVFNSSDLVVPERSYRVDLYIDGGLSCFDHAPAMLMPRSRAQYGYPMQLAPGRH